MTPTFRSKAAQDLYERRGLVFELCHEPEQATAEIERAMSGIAGFEGCKVVEVTRVTEGWEARIDDPRDEFEYHSFWLGDDGGCDWD